jgi:hypothetical protein
MIHARHTSAEGAAPRRPLGLSLPAIVLLAAIAAIRVPLHDLGSRLHPKQHRDRHRPGRRGRCGGLGDRAPAADLTRRTGAKHQVERSTP